jgi:hypothetical protein
MKKIMYFLKKFFILILIIIINFYIIFITFKNLHNSYKDFNKINVKKNDSFVNFCQMKTNIEYDDDFFQLAEVKQQIRRKKIIYIETIAGGYGNIGNALIILNKLINICENIKCKNVIAPNLDNIIKKPIIYKEKNIVIWPSSYKDKINVDIQIDSFYTIFYFNYKNKKIYNRLKIIREEVIANIPLFNNSPDDLVIHIRSGDIFINHFNRNYGQPPLCFYQRIINDNNFKNIYLTSSGRENPTINKLLQLYPKIKFINGTVEEGISAIIYSYNLVMSISTFPFTLIRLNNNLRKIYMYSLYDYDFNDINISIYKMEASQNYLNKIQGKWENTKEQLALMINENCTNANLSIMF